MGISPTDSEEEQVDTPAYLLLGDPGLSMGRRFLLAGKWEGVIPTCFLVFAPNASTYRGTLASILVRSKCALSFAVRSGTGSEIQWITLGQ